MDEYENMEPKESARARRRDKKHAAPTREPMNSGQNKYWHSVAQSLSQKEKKKALSKKRQAKQADQDQFESNVSNSNS